MHLHELKSPKGSRKRRHIVGRGPGSGHGKTSGRGHNGQKSRSGRGIQLQLEGGQMPLIRRIPKVGFRSHRPIFNQIVRVEDLNKLENGAVVNAETLKKNGLIHSLNKPFKILGDGELKKSLVFQTESVSKSARAKIEKAGGKFEKETQAPVKEAKGKTPPKK